MGDLCLKCHFDFQPEAWERPGGGGKGRGRFVPTKTRNYEELVGWTLRSAMVDQDIDMFTAPVGIILMLTRQAFIQQAGTGKKIKSGRADIDNLEKAILDGGNGVIWQDDWQVEAVHKQLIRGGETGSATVWIFPADEFDDRVVEYINERKRSRSLNHSERR